MDCLVASKPHLSLFWAAGFNFSLGRVLTEVPYDPTLDFLFFGEVSRYEPLGILL